MMKKAGGPDVRLIQRALELLGGDGGGKVEAHPHAAMKGKKQDTGKGKAHGSKQETTKWKAHGLPAAKGSS